MSMQLYFAPGACSFVPHVLLELAEADFEPQMVKLHKGEQQGPAYLALNPRGQVPVLVDGDQVVTQIVAIALHLDQRFASAGLLPAEPRARTQALSTLAWMNNTAHPTFTHFFKPQKFCDVPEAQAAIKAHSVGAFAAILGELQALVVAAQAAGHAFLTGDRVGPLDAYALTLARWGTIAGIAPDAHPQLWAFVQQVAAVPAVARVIERERLQLNVLASAP